MTVELMSTIDNTTSSKLAFTFTYSFGAAVLLLHCCCCCFGWRRWSLTRAIARHADTTIRITQIHRCGRSSTPTNGPTSRTIDPHSESDPFMAYSQNYCTCWFYYSIQLLEHALTHICTHTVLGAFGRNAETPATPKLSARSVPARLRKDGTVGHFQHTPHHYTEPNETRAWTRSSDDTLPQL